MRITTMFSTDTINGLVGCMCLVNPVVHDLCICKLNGRPSKPTIPPVIVRAAQVEYHFFLMRPCFGKPCQGSMQVI